MPLPQLLQTCFFFFERATVHSFHFHSPSRFREFEWWWFFLLSSSHRLNYRIVEMDKRWTSVINDHILNQDSSRRLLRGQDTCSLLPPPSPSAPSGFDVNRSVYYAAQLIIVGQAPAICLPTRRGGHLVARPPLLLAHIPVASVWERFPPPQFHLAELISPEILVGAVTN